MKNWNGPLFIVGNPRSGTTLLRLMLTSHSRLVIAPESGFITWWFNKYGNWTIDSNSSRIDQYLEDLQSSRRFEFWNLKSVELKKYILSVRPQNYSELIQAVYRRYNQTIDKGDAIWGDKNNHYLNHIDRLNSLFPNAKFLHIVRDGRDVATSYQKLEAIKDKVRLAPNLPSQIEDIAHNWNNNVTKINNSFRTLGNDKRYTIKYEELVCDPETTLKCICEYLHLEFEINMLNFHLVNQKHELVPKDYLHWKGETYNKLNTSAIGKYKTLLKEEEVKKFEKIALQSLKYFAYLS